MNNNRQVVLLEKLVRKSGIEPDLLDLKHEIDSKLSYQENKNIILNKIEELKGTTREIPKDEQDHILDENIRREIEYKKKLINQITENSKERQGEEKEILEAIKNYSPFTEKMVISTLLALSHNYNVINCSERGQSKSRNTRELLEYLGIPFINISGHLTPKSFFKILKANNNPEIPILIDESATIFNEKEILNMLLCALQREKVVWETSREREEVIFKGTIIFNTNYMPNNPIIRAVADRCIFNQINLNSQQIKEKIIKSKNYVFDILTWKKIKNNIFLKIKYPKEIKEKVYELIEQLNPLSYREITRLTAIAELSYKLFGTLRLLDFWAFDGLDELQIIINNTEMTKKDKVKQIMRIKNVSQRQAYRILKE